jgi:hypothetical protein
LINHTSGNSLFIVQQFIFCTLNVCASLDMTLRLWWIITLPTCCSSRLPSAWPTGKVKVSWWNAVTDGTGLRSYKASINRLCNNLTASKFHYMYRTVVTICTASLTFNNSAFCPHSVFMCFVWISEKNSHYFPMRTGLLAKRDCFFLSFCLSVSVSLKGFMIIVSLSWCLSASVDTQCIHCPARCPCCLQYSVPHGNQHMFSYIKLCYIQWNPAVLSNPQLLSAVLYSSVFTLLCPTMPYIFHALRITIAPKMFPLDGKSRLIKQICDLSTPASSVITGTHPVVIKSGSV